MLLKCFIQQVGKFEKHNNGHRTGKGQFSFQSQIKAIVREVSTTVHLHSFHTLAKYCSKSNYSVQVEFRKVRETRDQIASICWTIKKAREFQKNI